MTDERFERQYIDEKERGRQAFAELELTNEAYEAAEAAVIAAWVATQQADFEKREQLWHVLQGIRIGRVNLQSMVETGKLAEQSLAQIQVNRDAQRKFANLSRR